MSTVSNTDIQDRRLWARLTDDERTEIILRALARRENRQRKDDIYFLFERGWKLLSALCAKACRLFEYIWVRG